MKETDYAYAVARIRANETTLLTSSDINQLITSQDYESALQVLEKRGWISSGEISDIDSALKNQMEKAWQLLAEASPDISELEFLIVRNDFHNLKAALKAFVSANAPGSDQDFHDNFVTPSTIDPKLIRANVFENKFDRLPDLVKAAAQKAYEALTRSLDGQLADIMLDSAALNATIDRADRTENEFVKKTAELMGAMANIKIAVRAAKTGKDKQFLETALCKTKTIEQSSLANAAGRGVDELINYLLTTPYGEAAEYMKTSAISLEKWCDDRLVMHLNSAKYISLGIEPLVAFFIAKEAEVKNVRIILSCKHNKIPEQAIRERVRMLYV